MFFVLLSSQATALIDYHIFRRLSTTFLFFCFALSNFSKSASSDSLFTLSHLPAICQQLFSSCFSFFWHCIFLSHLPLSRQGCPACSVLHLLFQRRRLSYHRCFKLSTFFLFFIYFAQFRQFNLFTNTVYKISFFYFHVQQTYYYQKLFLFTIRKNLSLSDYTCLIYYRQRKAFLLYKWTVSHFR